MKATTVWSLLLIESTYLARLANTYAVHGKTKVLRGRTAAQLRGNVIGDWFEVMIFFLEIPEFSGEKVHYQATISSDDLFFV